jgi:long-chain acyl-CoA synthetase
MEIRRIFDLLPYYQENYGWKTDAVAGKSNGEWRRYSIQEYVEISNNISYGFLAKGVNPGDKIAIISTNRPEWNFLDMGIMQIGAIPVPIYPTISESDYQHILNHAEICYVIVEGEELLRKIEHILPEIPSLKGIYTFINRGRFNFLEELIQLGKENPTPEKVEEIKATIKSNDIATIIYTSGTTGSPKGVMLSHNNLIQNSKACSCIPPVGSEGIAMSFLPLCHVYERMMNYLYQYLGISVYYAENLGTIGENIKEIKPHILTTVPRLLEKIYDKIISNGRKLPWIQRQVFFWAVNIGQRFEFHNKNGWIYNIQLSIANKLVFSKWREALGGRFEVIVSGGASLQPRLGRVFTAAGIPIMEGYGLTETSPVIAVSNFTKHGRKFGTVGPVLPGVEVKIAEDGEILCRGHNVMLGYYKDPENTAEAIDKEGWFHTGDTGVIEPEGQLRITGRKKSIFKTSFGKYVNPQLIEEKFKESPFIENIIVVGENQKFAAALIQPDFALLKSYCKLKNIPYSTSQEIIQNDIIRKRIGKEVIKYNKFFGETEKVKKYEFISDEWSIQTRELTPTLKLKRNIINAKYKEMIDKLFE